MPRTPPRFADGIRTADSCDAPISTGTSRTPSAHAEALSAKTVDVSSQTGYSGLGSNSRISFPSLLFHSAQWTCDPLVTHTAARQPRNHTGVPHAREHGEATTSRHGSPSF